MPKSQKQKDIDVARKRALRAAYRNRYLNAERMRDEFNKMIIQSFPVLNSPDH